MTRVHRKALKMCISKARYPTFEAASLQRALRAVAGGPELRIYRCPRCRRFHLTKRMAKP